MDRREETKIVKKALKDEGIKAKVSHGKGTAWGWIEINIGDPTERNGIESRPDGCGDQYTTAEHELHARVIDIVQSVTGRKGNYNGNIAIHAQ
jgi:hypothetical protein